MTLREQVAIAAMSAILVRDKNNYISPAGVAKMAVQEADELLERLNVIELHETET